MGCALGCASRPAVFGTAALEVPLPWAHHAAQCRVRGACDEGRALTAELAMSDRLDAAEMPRLDAFDEELGQDPAAVQRGRRRRIMRRLWTFAAVAVGAGALAALALAWSTVDGRLRLEPQSMGASPQNAGREAADEEIDRLLRQVDTLKSEIGELTQARQQAADTIAALTAAQEEARSRVPPPAYWYSNPAALSLGVASRPETGAAAPPSRRPATARRESRDVRKRGSPAPLPLQPAQ